MQAPRYKAIKPEGKMERLKISKNVSTICVTQWIAAVISYE
jgi:hypothetical protein